MTRKQRRPELRILSRKAGSQFYVKARLKGRAFCLQERNRSSGVDSYRPQHSSRKVLLAI
jgi:hypothetical protein